MKEKIIIQGIHISLSKIFAFPSITLIWNSLIGNKGLHLPRLNCPCGYPLGYPLGYLLGYPHGYPLGYL